MHFQCFFFGCLRHCFYKPLLDGGLSPKTNIKNGKPFETGVEAYNCGYWQYDDVISGSVRGLKSPAHRCRSRHSAGFILVLFADSTHVLSPSLLPRSGWGIIHHVSWPHAASAIGCRSVPPGPGTWLGGEGARSPGLPWPVTPGRCFVFAA